MEPRNDRAMCSPKWPGVATISPGVFSAGPTPEGWAGQSQRLSSQKGEEVVLGHMSREDGVPLACHCRGQDPHLYSRPYPSGKPARSLGFLSCGWPSSWLDRTPSSRLCLGNVTSALRCALQLPRLTASLSPTPKVLQVLPGLPLQPVSWQRPHTAQRHTG